MAIPEDVADGDPSHDVHHNQLHDLYNYVEGLADGRVIVGAATPGVGTDLNLTTEAWISDADDISDTSTTNKFTTAAEISKLAGIEDGATADQTGAQIKTAYEAESDTNAFDDDAVAKLAAIEPLADVTDATNVNAAGAVMTGDTSTAGMGFVVDEDNMVSDSSTKVPTQQSVKQYVDNSVASAGGGDMLSTQNLADLQNATTARANLGVAIGTNVQAYSSVLDATTSAFTTADRSKLDGVADGATDTTNIADLDDVTSSGPTDAQVLAWNAANSDWRPTTFTVPAVLDEDNMVTDSATGVPSQQSTKAYVDASKGLSSKIYSGSSTYSLDLYDTAGRPTVRHHVTPIATTTITLPDYSGTSHPGWMTMQVRNNGVGYAISFAGTNYVLQDNVDLSRTPQPVFWLTWDPVALKWRVSELAAPLELLDEDDMATDSATRPPSQQSVKAYVDAEVAGVGGGEPSRSNTTHSATGTLAITTAAAKRHVVTTSNGNNISGYNLTYPPSGDVDIDLWILAPPSGSITVDLSVTPSASFLQEGTFTGTLTAGDAPFIIKIDRIG